MYFVTAQDYFATNNSDVNFNFSTVEASSFIPGWEPSKAIDNNQNTIFSSPISSQFNTENRYIAAWLSSIKNINVVKLKARLINNQPIGFPSQYRLSITNSANSGWIDLGVYNLQPNNEGLVRIVLNSTYSTYGLKIDPVELGKDTFNNYYFQLVDINFAITNGTPTPTPGIALLTTAKSKSNITGWPATAVLDNSSGSVYSSVAQTSSYNSNGEFIAAWFSGLVKVKKLVIVARKNGSTAIGFPKEYYVNVTNNTNSQWINLGNFSTQPDINGKVIISIPNEYSETYGVLITPSYFGTDNLGNYFLQISDIYFEK